jgi:hypothetical protein
MRSSEVEELILLALRDKLSAARNQVRAIVAEQWT